MARHLMIVFTNAVKGQEGEYNEWYSHRHIPDILQIPGVVSAKRFQKSAIQREGHENPFHYLAIYEIETDDLNQILTELQKRTNAGKIIISDALDSERRTYFYEAFSLPREELVKLEESLA